jgi:hypothetical protein
MKRKLGWVVLVLATLCLFTAVGTILISKAAVDRLALPPEIKVVNRSAEDLENVKLEGSGFSEDLGTLYRGEKRWVTVHPTGESGVYVSFLANGTAHKSDYESYFESSGGYRIIITIDRDFEIDSRYGSYLLP